jgi:AcrR family transcriptional regulator
MARPKSEDKRNAILAAAIQVFAERGLAAAPTAAISKVAGVAEGSLFGYFQTKDKLINELYCEIKRWMAETMLDGFPHEADVRTRLEHIWNSYVSWGVANPAERNVLRQLQSSTILTDASRAAGDASFSAIRAIAQDAGAQQLMCTFSEPFVAAALGALAETTMEFIAANPAQADQFRQAGFQIFWNGIATRT